MSSKQSTLDSTSSQWIFFDYSRFSCRQENRNTFVKLCFFVRLRNLKLILPRALGCMIAQIRFLKNCKHRPYACIKRLENKNLQLLSQKTKKWSDVFKNVTKFRSVTQTKCYSFLNKIVNVGFRKRKLLKIYFIHQICILSPHSLKEKTFVPVRASILTLPLQST